MRFEFVIMEAIREYGKNIIVNAFFGLLMTAFVWLQYILMNGDISYPLCTLLIFVGSLASAILVYPPFIISVNKGHITLLWKKVLRGVLILSVWWSVAYSLLFISFMYSSRNGILHYRLCNALFIASLFAVWFYMLLRVICIIFNAQSPELERTTLKTLILKDKVTFIKLLFLGLILITATFVSQGVKEMYDSMRAPWAIMFSMKEDLFISIFMEIQLFVMITYIYCCPSVSQIDE